MKRLFIPLLFLSVSAFGQFTKPQLYSNINTNIRLKTASQLRISAVLDSIVKSMATGSSMVYPGAGIVVSTGSAWGTSITDNSANWNTAFGWGNHAGLYWPLTGTGTLTGNVSIDGVNDYSISIPNLTSFLFEHDDIPNAGGYSKIEATTTGTGTSLLTIQAGAGTGEIGNIGLQSNGGQINSIVTGVTETVTETIDQDGWFGQYFNSGGVSGDTYEAYLLAGITGVNNKWSAYPGPVTEIKIGQGLGGDDAIRGFHVHTGTTGYSGDGGNLKLRIRTTGEWTVNLGSDAIGDTYQRNASGYFSRLAAVSAGSFLRSGGVATVNSWSTVKLPNTMSALGLWVANSANTTVNLTAAANQSIRVNSGGTAWEAYTLFGVTNLSTTTLSVTATSGDQVVLVDAATAGGTVTITLPTAVGNQAKIHVKKTDAGSNTVVVDGAGAETIDGISAATIYFQYQSITLVSNGTSWFII
jgi:hypothetical protein